MNRPARPQTYVLKPLRPDILQPPAGGTDPIAFLLQQRAGGTAAAVLEDWMDSPEHRDNILSDKPDSLGAGCASKKNDLGIATLTCVQMFSAP